VTNTFAVPAPEVPVLDDSRLAAEFGHVPEVLDELRTLFLTRVPPLYEAIVDAIVAADGPALVAHAHSLRGACSTFGAPHLAQVWATLEALGREADFDEAAGYRALLSAEFEQVIDQLRGLTVL